MPLRPALLTLLLALAPPARVLAQPPPPAQQPPPCALEMWSCIAGCLDGKCVERCAKPCAGALSGLRGCLRKAHCARGDRACWRSACPEACGRVFAAVGGEPGADPPARCAPQSVSTRELPQEWAGRWELTGASFVRQSIEREDQFVRSDYGLSLRLVSPGCFELETRMGEVTLGEGNALTLRIWGDVVMLAEDEWEAHAVGGALEGELCGELRDVALPSTAGRKVAHVRCALDHGALVFTSLSSPGRHLSFERSKE